jgi:uridylate kinase
MYQGSLGFGVDAVVMRAVAEEVKDLVMAGVRVAIVVGGGNYFRGANAWQGLDRATADYVGMLATVMNALQLQGALEGLGVDARVQVCMEWVY